MWGGGYGRRGWGGRGYRRGFRQGYWAGRMGPGPFGPWRPYYRPMRYGCLMPMMLMLLVGGVLIASPFLLWSHL